MGAREAAWWAVHDALPALWHVGPATFDPGSHRWSVTARSPHPGRGRIPVTVSGTGLDELAALRDLDARLRGSPRPAEDAARREKLNRKLRLAFYQGAEDEARRGSTTIDEAELGPILAHYPGDIVAKGARHEP